MMLSNGCTRHSSRGFSLLELLITITIIGIVGGIAVQAYRGYIDTAAVDVMHKKIEALRMFQENYRLDSDDGTYLEGTYDPEGTNDFDVIGFRVDGDDDDVTLVVTACDGGVIKDCFKVVATDRDGRTVTWNDGAYLTAP